MVDDRQIVVFKLAQEHYGLPIDQVREINRLSEITKLPQTPSFMEGIVNLRGKIIPIVDLRKRFGLAVHNTEDTRIVVVDLAEHTVGIIVDDVTEVMHLATDNIEAVPSSFIMDAEYLDGLGKFENRLIILLKLEKILNSQEQDILNYPLQ